MLDVFPERSNRNLCVVVTRYFGGVLLGTGGLVRAYSGAAKAGLEDKCGSREKLAEKIRVITDYNGLRKDPVHCSGTAGIMTLDTQYTDKVQRLHFWFRGKRSSTFRQTLTEGTNGKAKIRR